MRRAELVRYLILGVQREGNRLLSQALRPLGLTPSQAEVLRVLHERAPLTLNQLGVLLICESGTSPSRLVDRLVAVDLVHRVTSAEDRRHVTLTLTEQGVRLAEQVAEAEEALYHQIDAVLKEHDAQALTDFLAAFIAELPAGQALQRRRRPDRDVGGPGTN